MITGQNFLDEVAATVIRILSGITEGVFGPRVHDNVIGSVSWVDLAAVLAIVLLFFIAHAATVAYLKRKHRQANAQPETAKGDFLHLVINTIAKPAYLLIWVCGVYVAAAPIILKLQERNEMEAERHVINKLFGLAVFVVLFWLFFRFTRVVEARLQLWSSKTESKLDDLIAPLLGRSLRIVLPVIGIIFALPLIGLPAQYADVVAHGSSILIIITVAWVLFQGVRLMELGVLAKYDIKAADNLEARKVYTQVHVISKTLYVLISIFTVASILMLFEEVRRFGTSILASAGVVGIIIGFAAQRTIANLFAGFQLAMTQPIRIDDVVIVENEWGRVEEITLTYVIIHIWDDRRLVVPLSYFIEKPFQNWTRVSASLLGSVFMWTDYTLPLAEVRKALREIVEGNPLWDRRFWNLQVTDATEHTMQIRVLATAADSSKAWDLRCEIREKLIEFVQRQYPQSLPRTRVGFDRTREQNPDDQPSGGPPPVASSSR